MLYLLRLFCLFLSADSFDARVSADSRLRELLPLSLPVVVAGCSSPNVEVRERCRGMLPLGPLRAMASCPAGIGWLFGPKPPHNAVAPEEEWAALAAAVSLVAGSFRIRPNVENLWQLFWMLARRDSPWKYHLPDK